MPLTTLRRVALTRREDTDSYCAARQSSSVIINPDARIGVTGQGTSTIIVFRAYKRPGPEPSEDDHKNRLRTTEASNKWKTISRRPF